MELGSKCWAQMAGQPPKHSATQKPAAPGKATARSPPHILALPNDVAHIILSNLEFIDKINAGLVCKHWDELLKAGTGAARHWVVACNFDRLVSKGVVPSRWFVNHAAAIKGVHLSATLSSDGQGAATREVLDQLPLLAYCLPKHGTTLHLKFNYGYPFTPSLLSRSVFQALCPMVKTLQLCELRGCITPSQFAAICQLSSLEDLHISGCDTKCDTYKPGLQEITSDLSKLENLRGLSLERNGSLRSIPKAISCLQKLEHIHMGGISFQDMSFSLANLISLCMESCPSRDFPRSFQGLKSVARVAFKGCMLDSIPEALSSLASLTSLEITYSPFRSGRHGEWPWWPIALSRVDRLAQLVLGPCNIFSLPPHISAFVRLTRLELNHNYLSSLPREMSSLQNLRVLQAQFNRFSTIPVYLLNTVTALTSMSLARQFCGVPPPCLHAALNIVVEGEADFSCSESDDEEDEDSSGQSALSGSSSLTLDLSYNFFGLSDADPPLREQWLQWPATTVSRLRNLGELNLSANCLSILPSDISQLWRLTKLDVSDNMLGSLPEELTRLQNLRDLFADHNFFGAIPVSVLSRLTALTSISLRNQSVGLKVSSSVLPILHPGLVKLDLSKDAQWDPRSLRFLRCAMVEVADRTPTVTVAY